MLKQQFPIVCAARNRDEFYASVRTPAAEALRAQVASLTANTASSNKFASKMLGFMKQWITMMGWLYG